MNGFEVNQIGKVKISDEGTIIEVDEKYRPALEALEGFSHINVIWWFSKYDSADLRSVLNTKQPYKNAPKTMGIFATRSPVRPNPIALTACEVLGIDFEKGIIRLAFIDAEDNTPVLDIKPYTPSFDRVENPAVPSWCKNWPKSTEESGYFNWEEVFNF